MPAAVNRLLVIRFSAMGDVLMARPVIENFLRSFPDAEPVFVTSKIFAPFFQDMPRLKIIAIDLKGRHRGIAGIWRLSHEIRSLGVSHVADIHNVFRSRLLTFFLRLFAGKIQTSRIDKGRSEKRALTRRYNKKLAPLKHSIERYAEVFAKTGFPLDISAITAVTARVSPAEGRIDESKSPKIGIAPLSRHAEKEWPLSYMRKLIELLIQKYSAKIYILGSKAEQGILNDYFGDLAEITAGALDAAGEIKLVESLDLVVSMDSANAHLAAVLGIPAAVIWGPTHPFAGFAPAGNFHRHIQNDTLPCRPCSVFGNKPCFRKDHACMTWLYPETVIGEIDNFLRQIKKYNAHV